MSECEHSVDGLVRAFIAVEVPSDVRTSLTAAIERFRRTGAHVSWIAPENLHVTLAFLGDVNVTALARVEKLLDEVSAEEVPFDLECAGIGLFGSPRAPRVIWAGVKDVGGRLGALQQRLAVRLREAGFSLDDRPFHAHVTLGRVRSQRGARDLTLMVGSDKRNAFGRCRVERLVLMRSRLDPHGATYTIIHASPMKGVERE